MAFYLHASYIALQASAQKHCLQYLCNYNGGGEQWKDEGGEKRENKIYHVMKWYTFHMTCWWQVTCASPRAKKKALVFNTMGRISSHMVDKTLNTGMTWYGWEAAQWLELMCSFHSCVHGVLMAYSQICACVCVSDCVCLRKQWQTHIHAHTHSGSLAPICEKWCSVGNLSRQMSVPY